MLSAVPLTFDDVLTAAVIAVFVVIALRLLGWAIRAALARTRHIQFDPERVAEVRSRCSRLFPVENLIFDGATVTRGAIIRIITRQQFAIEGEFMGTNYSNMLCLVTREAVIAQELQAIETIQVIGQARSGV